MKTIVLLIMLVFAGVYQFANANTLRANTFQDVLQNYLDLKNALAADDAKSSQTSAQNLASALNDLQVNDLSESERSAWDKYSDKLKSTARHISESDNIDDQRKHFKSLSSQLYDMLPEFKTQTVLYYQYCPMADDDTGAYWISEIKKITNPYMGKRMLRCGETKETISSSK